MHCSSLGYSQDHPRRELHVDAFPIGLDEFLLTPVLLGCGLRELGVVMAMLLLPVVVRLAVQLAAVARLEISASDRARHRRVAL